MLYTECLSFLINYDHHLLSVIKLVYSLTTAPLISRKAFIFHFCFIKNLDA